MDRVLGVVLSYHPTQEILENVRLLLEQVNHVVIVDNYSTEKSRQLLGFLPKDQINIIWNEVNQGVATGFNQGIRWGLENNFKYFLLMDQDSQIGLQMVNQLLTCLKSHEGYLTIVGPHHVDKSKPQNANSEKSEETVSLLITSGSLVTKTVIDKIGFYDDALFIDHVDHDYCLRLASAGGRCLKVNSAVLYHKFGKAKIHTFLGKSFFIQDYSPFRRYHMMRNRIVLYKRYGAFTGDWFWIDLRSAIKDLIKLIFFENNKGQKLKAVLRGLWDGLLWQDNDKREFYVS